MSEPVWRFVSDVSVDPAKVRLDMNAGAYRLLSRGFSVPAPELRRTVSANRLTDGGTASAGVYDLREVSFTLLLEAPTAASRRGQLRQLTAELDRERNIIHYRHPDASTDVFLRVFRTSDWSVNYSEDFANPWAVSVTMLAEPYALGLPEEYGPVTVTNDPAAGTNPGSLVIPAGAVSGDAGTPAVVQLDYSAASSVLNCILGTRGSRPVDGMDLEKQAESGQDLSADTVEKGSVVGEAADSEMSNGSYLRCDFSASSAMETRWRIHPLTSGNTRGDYRVLMRCRKKYADDVIRVRFLFGATGSPSYSVVGRTVTLPDAATPLLVDLGVVSWPRLDMPAGLGYSTDGISMAAGGNAPLWIQADWVSGNADGFLDMDYIRLLPADERLSVTNWRVSDASIVGVLDGPQDTQYLTFGGVFALADYPSPDRSGGLPLVYPVDHDQHWYLVQQSAVEFWDRLTDTVDISIRWWPRYLEVPES